MSATAWAGSLSPEAVMAQAKTENFPVAGPLAGARAASHLLAVYGFARLVDDLGDEAPGDRGALLDWADEQLELIFGAGEVQHPLMVRLSATVEACSLPKAPLRRLVEANRRDQTVARYEDFEDLLGYCRLSADPVGELVLHVYGCPTPERIELSNRICSALQVIEHLQDAAEDFARGRVYLPAVDLRRFGCAEAALGEVRAGLPLRAVVAFEAARCEQMLRDGAPLIRRLPLRARPAVAAFVAGGRAALRDLAARRFDVCGSGPRRSRRRLALALPGAVMGR
jgi:squalene synthase HpnC